MPGDGASVGQSGPASARWRTARVEFVRGFCALAAVGALCACIPAERAPREVATPVAGAPEAGAGGDYAALTCDQLAAAMAALESRSAGAPARYGAATPQGAPTAERRPLVEEAMREVTRAQERRACAGPSPAPEPPAAALVADGRRLQVATFEFEFSRDAALAFFAERGLAAEARPATVNGIRHWRILLGPFPDPAAFEAADRAARDLGLNDAFLTNG